MYTPSVDQVNSYSVILAKWGIMKWFMGCLGFFMIGNTALDFTLMAKLGAFGTKMAVFEAHLDEMRRDIALIKGKVLGVPIAVEALGVPPLAKTPISTEKETKK
ncbi:hypothetical protein TWF506_010512 [Arthrobotrys conoides]|uniref:Uncharacterized protein n=1 Tax=Arthrobotrys conoides TaxID=74498 RepID=A0AAN8N1R4_9PEZI